MEIDQQQIMNDQSLDAKSRMFEEALIYSDNESSMLKYDENQKTISLNQNQFKKQQKYKDIVNDNLLKPLQLLQENIYANNKRIQRFLKKKQKNQSISVVNQENIGLQSLEYQLYPKVAQLADKQFHPTCPIKSALRIYNKTWQKSPKNNKQQTDFQNILNNEIQNHNDSIDNNLPYDDEKFKVWSNIVSHIRPKCQIESISDAKVKYQKNQRKQLVQMHQQKQQLNDGIAPQIKKMVSLQIRDLQEIQNLDDQFIDQASNILRQNQSINIKFNENKLQNQKDEKKLFFNQTKTNNFSRFETIDNFNDLMCTNKYFYQTRCFLKQSLYDKTDIEPNIDQQYKNRRTQSVSTSQNKPLSSELVKFSNSNYYPNSFFNTTKQGKLLNMYKKQIELKQFRNTNYNMK